MGPHIIKFPKVIDQRGRLTYLHNQQQIPFDIRGVSWGYNTLAGGQAEDNSTGTPEQVVIALQGSFEAVVANENGVYQRFTLDRPDCGLYLPACASIQGEYFSDSSLCLSLSSQHQADGETLIVLDLLNEKEGSRTPSVADCKVVQLPTTSRFDTCLTSVKNMQEVPFATKSVYYLYSIPEGESRGGHAHRALQQLVVAVRGSFDVTVNDKYTS